MDNKVLVAISSIGIEQASPTEATSLAANQLLDYVATYPNDGILYQTSNLTLAKDVAAWELISFFQKMILSPSQWTNPLNHSDHQV